MMTLLNTGSEPLYFGIVILTALVLSIWAKRRVTLMAGVSGLTGAAIYWTLYSIAWGPPALIAVGFADVAAFYFVVSYAIIWLVRKGVDRRPVNSAGRPF